MSRTTKLMLTIVIAASATGCHYFVPTEPGIGISVLSGTAGPEFRFVNCTDHREVLITRVEVRPAGPHPDPNNSGVLCGVSWQHVVAPMPSSRSWRYAEVPRGYARLGECLPLPAPGSYVVLGSSPVHQAQFTIGPDGAIRPGPACLE